MDPRVPSGFHLGCFYDEQWILGDKAFLYRKVPGGPVYWRYYVAAEKKRVVKSLKTRDMAVAIQLATERTLEAMSKERSGERVVSGTLRDAIRAFAAKQRARLERGEIRSADRVDQNITDLTKQCEKYWGLDTPLSAMTQAKWDIYVEQRTDVKLSTLKSHLERFRWLMRDHGVKLGAPCVPDFSYLVVPPDQRSKRFTVINEEQWEELATQAIKFCLPENENGTYRRSFSLSAYKPRGTGNKFGKLDNEKEGYRRKLMYRLIMVAAATGCRPHELCGYSEKSIRWMDVKEQDFEVETKQLSVQPRQVVLFSIRKNTKTGQRMVPAACGEHISALRSLCPDQSQSAPVFQDWNGKPFPLGYVHRYWNEIVSRCPSIEHEADIYEVRHLWATRRLKEGVPVATVAKAMGNSIAVVEKTYAHLMLSDEAAVRQLYESASL